MGQKVDVAALLDHGSWSTTQKLLTGLIAVAVVFDGFDIQILGFAIPSLMKDWHAARSQFGPVLALGLAGMALGGPIAATAATDSDDGLRWSAAWRFLRWRRSAPHLCTAFRGSACLA